MPSTRPSELQAVSEYAEFLNSNKPLLHVWSPIFLHAKNDTGKPCPCCGSLKAVKVQEIGAKEILIDRLRGTRKDRDEVQDKDRFDELARSHAKRLEMPTRVYDEQLPVVLDDKHKVIGVFGGNRSGKSTVGAEWLKRRILELGGPGSQFWWVAPTREKSRIGVRKLVLGERTDRYVPPLLPPELIASYPKNEKSSDQVIRLVDGTEIHLKFAGRKGGNLKGDPCVAIVLDEGCEIPHLINWTILTGRTIDSGGQLLVSTTPVAGHWLRDEVADRGKTYAELEDGDDIVSLNLSCFRNPWVDPNEVERAVKSMKDQARVKREIYGEWVGENPMLWHYFDSDIHLREGASRSVEEWGLKNITPVVARKVFKAPKTDLKTVGGVDFNFWPMSLVLVQVGVPPGVDESDPNNWVLCVQDEVIRRVTHVSEFVQHINGEAHKSRGLQQGALKGLSLACDSTGAQWKHPKTTGITDRNVTLVKTLKQSGFDARPCWVHPETGSPQNPAVLDRVSLCHKLMQERIDLPNGAQIPRLIVHASRCQRLIHSLETQEADARGKPAKQPNTVSDRLSGPTDALGYIAWALFYRSSYGTQTKANW